MDIGGYELATSEAGDDNNFCGRNQEWNFQRRKTSCGSMHDSLTSSPSASIITESAVVQEPDHPSVLNGSLPLRPSFSGAALNKPTKKNNWSRAICDVVMVMRKRCLDRISRHTNVDPYHPFTGREMGAPKMRRKRDKPTVDIDQFGN